MPDKEKQSQFARNVITRFMERNRLTITTESRILGDEYVRFGGEYIETCFHKGKQGALCLAIGTGKTLIMCMAAHEMKRLGMAHKPMIIGLKANVAEIAATYQTAYPHARILYASEKDFPPRTVSVSSTTSRTTTMTV